MKGLGAKVLVVAEGEATDMSPSSVTSPNTSLRATVT